MKDYLLEYLDFTLLRLDFSFLLLTLILLFELCEIFLKLFIPEKLNCFLILFIRGNWFYFVLFESNVIFPTNGDSHLLLIALILTVFLNILFFHLLIWHLVILEAIINCQCKNIPIYLIYNFLSLSTQPN